MASKTKSRANGEGSIYQDKDGVWWAQRYLPGGGYLRRRSKTHAGAVEKMRELQQLKVKPKREAVAAQKKTVREFAEKWLEDRRDKIARKTHETYEWLLRKHILPEIGKMTFADLRFTHVKDMANKIGRKEGVGRNTVHSAIRTLHKIIVDAKREGVYPALENPATKIELPIEEKTERVYSLSDGITLVRYVRQSPPPLREAVIFALYTGARLGEVRGLRWCDLVENSYGHVAQICGQIEKVEAGERTTRSGTIRQAFTYRHKPRTKTNRALHVTLESEVVACLEYLRLMQQEAGVYSPEGFVFLERPKFERSNHALLTQWRPITAGLLRKRLKGLCEAAGVDYKAFHAFRRTFITWLGDEEVAVHAISKTVGHSHQSTTSDIYAAQTLRSSKIATTAMRELLERSMPETA